MGMNKGNNRGSYGDGLASNRNTPERVMNIAEAGREKMNLYAKGGGLMGMQEGGDLSLGVKDTQMMMKKGGGTKKGMKRKTARRAYMKK